MSRQKSRGWHKIRCRVSCRNKLKFLQNSKFVWRAQLLKCYLIIYLKSNHFVFLSMICLGVLRSHICVQSSELSRYCVADTQLQLKSAENWIILSRTLLIFSLTALCNRICGSKNAQNVKCKVHV